MHYKEKGMNKPVSYRFYGDESSGKQTTGVASASRSSYTHIQDDGLPIWPADDARFRQKDVKLLSAVTSDGAVTVLYPC